MSRVSSYATVQLTIEIRGLGSWGPECQIDQVHKQAKREALEKLARATKGTRDFRVIGEPVVSTITHEEER